MHILLIPSWYPSSENPVRGVFFREQALALQKKGYKVGVLVMPKLRSKHELVQVRRPADLRLNISYENDHDVITCRSEQWGWFPGRYPQANLRLRIHTGKQVFRDYMQNHGKPDIIHAHSVFLGGYLATQIGRRWSIPVVLTEHSTAFLRNTFQPNQVKIARSTLNSTQKNIAVGNHLAKILQTYDLLRQVDVIGNLVNTDYFVPAHQILHPSPFIFSSIGILRPKKGMDILLIAFASAFKGAPVHLNIGGNGPEENNLQQQAKDLEISSQVNFLGRLSRNQTRHLIQRSHSIVSASYIETFGITLIESMACGKPVIATRSGGPESFVNPQNGILAPSGDPPALAATMQQMVQNYSKFDPTEIRAYCVANFSEQAIVQKLENTYYEVLSI